ncbi:MAG: hypothetical protein ACUVXJ_10240 [Phycisphaerae bacterium]
MTRLMVNIDTEEEGLFRGRYPTREWCLGHLAELPRLQAIFDRFGMRPTYQVTTPVILDPIGSAYLERFLEEGRCDIGGHLHPWVTEPLAGLPADDAHSMPCMLAPALVRAKLITLTRQIRERFGVQPIAYRSGRYGSSAAHTPFLLELGYRVETSVCPFVSHAPFGGPDYFDAPLTPYWLGSESMLEPEPSGQLLCVPISAGFSSPDFGRMGRLYRRLARTRLRHLRLVGLLHRLRLVRLIRLNPEMTSLDDMILLCRALLRRGAELLHLTFHSSNIGIGGTPYVPDRGARDAFLDRLSGVLDFLVNDSGVRPVTAREYHDLVSTRRTSPAGREAQHHGDLIGAATACVETACCT